MPAGSGSSRSTPGTRSRTAGGADAARRARQVRRDAGLHFPTTDGRTLTLTRIRRTERRPEGARAPLLEASVESLRFPPDRAPFAVSRFAELEAGKRSRGEARRATEAPLATADQLCLARVRRLRTVEARYFAARATGTPGGTRPSSEDFGPFRFAAPSFQR